MHIVSTTDKNIYFIPRQKEKTAYPAEEYEDRVLEDDGTIESLSCVTKSPIRVVITDELENETDTISTTMNVSGNYVVCDLDYTFKEGRFYYFVVQGITEIYRGKIFCTDQTDLESYTVNQGQYTSYEKANANEYITI